MRKKNSNGEEIKKEGKWKKRFVNTMLSAPVSALVGFTVGYSFRRNKS